MDIPSRSSRRIPIAVATLLLTLAACATATDGAASSRATLAPAAATSIVVEFFGDDTLYDLELRTDVPVFGDTRGDVLTYECFSDGAPVLERFARAGGVQLTWTSVPDVRAETDAGLATALASLGIVSRAGG